MTFSITHSGQRFTSLGISGRGHHIWSIEEYLVRRRHTPTVAARIRRLNPDGKEEGSSPRGWHPARTVGGVCLLCDLIPIGDFRSSYGSEALRALPKHAFAKIGGKRRALIPDVVVPILGWKVFGLDA